MANSIGPGSAISNRTPPESDGCFNLRYDTGFGPQERGMSNYDAQRSSDTGKVPVTTLVRAPAVRRERAIAVVATAMGALALGALAVGALAIGTLAIGQLALGRAKLRSGQVDELRIARLTIEELRVGRVL
jgi:hypothetical protein